MGICIYCNQPAGIFRSKHKECFNKYKKAKKDIIEFISGLLKNNKEASVIRAFIDDRVKSSFIKDDEIKKLMYAGWCLAIENAFDDGLLTTEEENQIFAIATTLGLSQDELKATEGYKKIVKGILIRHIMEGNIPDNLNIEVDIPLNLQKDEKIIWAFPHVNYSEEKTKTHYEGSSTGASVRIFKGFYLRQSAFKGHPVKTDVVVHMDNGSIVVTSKHIYFHGSRKSFRIKYAKIVSFQPYSDAISIMQDNKTARPQIFHVDDAWFLYNLVSNLARM